MDEGGMNRPDSEMMFYGSISMEPAGGEKGRQRQLESKPILRGVVERGGGGVGAEDKKSQPKKIEGETGQLLDAMLADLQRTGEATKQLLPGEAVALVGDVLRQNLGEEAVKGVRVGVAVTDNLAKITANGKIGPLPVNYLTVEANDEGDGPQVVGKPKVHAILSGLAAASGRGESLDKATHDPFGELAHITTEQAKIRGVEGVQVKIGIKDGHFVLALSRPSEAGSGVPVAEVGRTGEVVGQPVVREMDVEDQIRHKAEVDSRGGRFGRLRSEPEELVLEEDVQTEADKVRQEVVSPAPVDAGQPDLTLKLNEKEGLVKNVPEEVSRALIVVEEQLGVRQPVGSERGKVELSDVVIGEIVEEGGKDVVSPGEVVDGQVRVVDTDPRHRLLRAGAINMARRLNLSPDAVNAIGTMPAENLVATLEAMYPAFNAKKSADVTPSVTGGGSSGNEGGDRGGSTEPPIGGLPPTPEAQPDPGRRELVAIEGKGVVDMTDQRAPGERNVSQGRPDYVGKPDAPDPESKTGSMSWDEAFAKKGEPERQVIKVVSGMSYEPARRDADAVATQIRNKANRIDDANIAAEMHAVADKLEVGGEDADKLLKELNLNAKHLEQRQKQTELDRIANIALERRSRELGDKITAEQASVALDKAAARNVPEKPDVQEVVSWRNIAKALGIVFTLDELGEAKFQEWVGLQKNQGRTLEQMERAARDASPEEFKGDRYGHWSYEDVARAYARKTDEKGKPLTPAEIFDLKQSILTRFKLAEKLGVFDTHTTVRVRDTLIESEWKDDDYAGKLAVLADQLENETKNTVLAYGENYRLRGVLKDGVLGLRAQARLDGVIHPKSKIKPAADELARLEAEANDTFWKPPFAFRDLIDQETTAQREKREAAEAAAKLTGVGGPGGGGENGGSKGGDIAYTAEELRIQKHGTEAELRMLGARLVQDIVDAKDPSAAFQKAKDFLAKAEQFGTDKAMVERALEYTKDRVVLYEMNESANAVKKSADSSTMASFHNKAENEFTGFEGSARYLRLLRDSSQVCEYFETHKSDLLVLIRSTNTAEVKAMGARIKAALGIDEVKLQTGLWFYGVHFRDAQVDATVVEPAGRRNAGKRALMGQEKLADMSAIMAYPEFRVQKKMAADLKVARMAATGISDVFSMAFAAASEPEQKQFLERAGVSFTTSVDGRTKSSVHIDRVPFTQMAAMTDEQFEAMFGNNFFTNMGTDGMKKAVATREAIDGWYKKRDWNSLGTVWAQFRHLFPRHTEYTLGSGDTVILRNQLLATLAKETVREAKRLDSALTDAQVKANLLTVFNKAPSEAIAGETKLQKVVLRDNGLPDDLPGDKGLGAVVRGVGDVTSGVVFGTRPGQKIEDKFFPGGKK